VGAAEVFDPDPALELPLGLPLGLPLELAPEAVGAPVGFALLPAAVGPLAPALWAAVGPLVAAPVTPKAARLTPFETVEVVTQLLDEGVVNGAAGVVRSPTV